MSIERAREFFRKLDIEDKVLEFETSSATVELAAKAVGCEPARIAKTLSFLVEDKSVLVVTAGDRKVNNAKYKAFFGKKAKMIPGDCVEELIGHEVGGVCPFGINDGVLVYLDESLKRFDSVYPACGSSNSAIKMTMEELARYSGYQAWIDVCKPICEA